MTGQQDMADLGNMTASGAIKASLTMGVTMGSVAISAIMAFSEAEEVSSSSPGTAGGRTIHIMRRQVTGTTAQALGATIPMLTAAPSLGFQWRRPASSLDGLASASALADSGVTRAPDSSARAPSMLSSRSLVLTARFITSSCCVETAASPPTSRTSS